MRIVLAEKAVGFETVEIDLANRPAWLYAKNPSGKVPVLEHWDRWALAESAVISEYLNDLYPDPPLWPEDAARRAAGRLLVFRFDDFSEPYYSLRRNEEGAHDRFEGELAHLDGFLESTPWLSGRAFGLADIAFLPWILRARERMGVSLDEFPRLRNWVERAEERPSVAAELAVVRAL